MNLDKIQILTYALTEGGLTIGKCKQFFNQDISEILSISNNGGLKINLKFKPIYIHKRDINNYNIVSIGTSEKFLIFDQWYDVDLVINCFKQVAKIELEKQLIKLNKKIQAIDTVYLADNFNIISFKA